MDLKAEIRRLRDRAAATRRAAHEEDEITRAVAIGEVRACNAVLRLIGRHNNALVLTTAELHQIRLAAGNTAAEPHWRRDCATRALDTAAAKVGFHVATEDI